MPDVQVLHRNRFQPVDGAQAVAMAGNAWEIRIPVDHPIHRRVRREPEPTAWDGAIFLLGDEETEPALGSAIRKGNVCIAAWIA